MIALILTILPTLLWDESPATAPDLRAAGIHEIAVMGDAKAWSSTGVSAIHVDESKMIRLDSIGVDYQIDKAGATASPWINSNLWRMIRDPEASFVYTVPPKLLPLAVAEGYTGGARTYFRVRRRDLGDFAAPYRFLQQLHEAGLAARVNFTLLDDRSPEMEEIMNLLARRNLLFETVRGSPKRDGMQVRIGSREYPRKTAEDPYLFAAMVRSRVGDDNRLVRVYGTETVLVRVYGEDRHLRVHLLQYGSTAPQSIRVRVLGHYPRVSVSKFGASCSRVSEMVLDNSATEFTVPDIGPFAIVDLEKQEPGVLHSAKALHEVPLTADPASEFWNAAPPVRAGKNTFGKPAGAEMEVRSRWTADWLYLLYICPFDRLHLKPDPVTDRDTPGLWDWDVAEAFIGTDPSNAGHYFEFELSPQGEWVDLDISCSNDDPKHDTTWNSGYQVVARIDRDRRIWYGAMKIPMRALRSTPPEPGERFKLNLYRASGPPPQTKYVSWQPTYRRTFHGPDSFGMLMFDK